jgi:1,4-alpha-glucan branching enzyme
VKPAPSALDALLEGRHPDPFSLFGAHPGPGGTFARVWIPGAERAEAHDLKGRRLGSLTRIDKRGLFEGKILGALGPVKYKAQGFGAHWWVTDPYSFGPVLGPMDDLLIAEGTHWRLYDKLGAHLISHEGVTGVHFAVWAPNAQRVSVVADFNDWDGRRHVMRRRVDIGVWEIFIPDIANGRSYKFEIIGADGKKLPLKADPFAFAAEFRPATASLTTAPPDHVWGDEAHRAFWAKADARRQPISIYEVHAGSWDRDARGHFLSWDALADRLIPYVADMGFTHIEFMPISEHPYDPSWGYQTTGLYAPSSRFGDIQGFARFVDGAHRAGLGVLIDWVPAHFPTDPHGLIRFDGTALYEHEDPRLGHHPDWDTAIYNFGRREVCSFLVNNALFWAERYHVDGLRVDAVASMLYRDYSRKSGEWIPNAQGGRENWEAVEFLQAMNRSIYGTHPGVFTVAEESTSWPGVSKPVHENGLGFGFKWNMGFMHDTLKYMSREPVFRSHHHDDITFGLLYAFSENFVLPLSHDEVVHGKGSLLSKMSGDDWQKFANLRAYYAFMWGYPGKKLLFMGQEFAQRREWSESRRLDWDLLDAPAHAGVRVLVRDLNLFYRDKPALHARDCESEGFSWSVVDDRQNSVFAWIRHAPGAAPIAVIANMTPVPRHAYRVPLPADGIWKEMVNSDALQYGGSGIGNLGTVTAKDGGAELTLPPLATIMLEHSSE